MNQRNPSTFEYDVFLSHNSKDKPIVRELARKLKAAGFKVWFDEWVILPGMSIPDAIEKGLQNTRTLVLCMSDNAFQSDWVSLERQTATFRDPINKERRFIPLLIGNADVPDMLQHFAYIDYQAPTDEAFERLVASLR